MLYGVAFNSTSISGRNAITPCKLQRLGWRDIRSIPEVESYLMASRYQALLSICLASSVLQNCSQRTSQDYLFTTCFRRNSFYDVNRPQDSAALWRVWCIYISALDSGKPLNWLPSFQSSKHFCTFTKLIIPHHRITDPEAHSHSNWRPQLSSQVLTTGSRAQFSCNGQLFNNYSCQFKFQWVFLLLDSLILEGELLINWNSVNINIQQRSLR